MITRHNGTTMTTRTKTRKPLVRKPKAMRLVWIMRMRPGESSAMRGSGGSPSGRRRIRTARVVDATGTEMASSGLVTLFNDMCLLAPATLIDKRIRWVPVDSLTAKGSIEDAGRSVSATLHFNQDGELTDFVTDDRYMESSGRFRKTTWSTPVSQYKDFHGITLASHGAGVWHLDEGDFIYAEFDLQSIEYNTAS